MMPQLQEFGGWVDGAEVPETLIALIAQYVEARSPQLDAILEQAGVPTYFADHVEQATAVPDTTDGAQLTKNRPYAVN